MQGQCFMGFGMSSISPDVWRDLFPKQETLNRRECRWPYTWAFEPLARGYASTPLRTWGPARVKPSRTTQKPVDHAWRPLPSDVSQYKGITPNPAPWAGDLVDVRCPKTCLWPPRSHQPRLTLTLLRQTRQTTAGTAGARGKSSTMTSLMIRTGWRPPSPSGKPQVMT